MYVWATVVVNGKPDIQSDMNFYDINGEGECSLTALMKVLALSVTIYGDMVHEVIYIRQMFWLFSMS